MRKYHTQFRVTHYPQTPGINQVDAGLHVVAFDEGDRGLPDLDFVRQHYVRLTGGHKVEMSEFESTEVFQSGRSGTQQPEISDEASEVFIIPNSAKPDSAVTEVKLQDPTFKTDPT